MSPTYVVFVTVSPVDPPPDPMAVDAVVMTADDEAAAVARVVELGALGAAPQMRACDLAETQTFDVVTEVAVEPTPEPKPVL